MKLPEQFLCVITGGGTDPVTMAGMALRGGASMIQLRDKSATGEQLYRWAVAIQKLSRRHHAVFIVNDRVDIALAMNADGVHLGQTDLPPEAARALLGADKIIGVSVANASEALDAFHEGASYIGLGHIFPTGSKLKTSNPLGLDTISAVAAACPLPIVAIGGINENNAGEAIAAGASGVAVIAAVCSAENPEDAARTLVASIRRNAS